MDNIKDKYDFIGEFHQGVAIVVKDDKYGAILVGGHEIISPTYDYISTFKDGYAQAIRKGECKILDLSGRECKKYNESLIAIPSKYDSVRDFNDGYACVSINGKWGAIDIRGNEIFEPQFYYLSDFVGGSAKYKKEKTNVSNLWGYVHADGYCSECNLEEPIIEDNGDLIIHRYTDTGHEKVRINNKGQLVVKNGDTKVTLDKKYILARDFTCGIARVQDSTGYWGCINLKGSPVVPFEYTKIQKFSENRAFAYNKNEELCLISVSGVIIKKFNQYSFAYPFKNGYSIVGTHDEKYVLINEHGNEVSPHFDGSIEYTDFPGEFKIIENGLEGYYKVLTKLFIKPQFEKIMEVQNDCLQIEVQGIGKVTVDFDGRPFLDGNPRIYFPDWCSGAKQLTDGIYVGASKNGKFGLISAEGNTLCEPVIETISEVRNNFIITSRMHVSRSHFSTTRVQKCGLYNIESKIHIPADYDSCPELKGNYYLTLNNGMYGVVDLEGCTVLMPEWKSITAIEGGYIVCKIDWKNSLTGKENYGLVDRCGKFIIEPNYNEIVILGPSMYKARSGEIWRIYDENGVLTKEPFDEVSLDGDTFIVKSHGLDGRLDKRGKKIVLLDDGTYVELPSKFSWGYDFKEGIAKVDIAGFDMRGVPYQNYVDKLFHIVIYNNNTVVAVDECVDYLYERDNYGNYIFVSCDKYGLLSPKGKVLIKASYDNLESIAKDLYIASIYLDDRCNMQHGVIDVNGNIIIDFKYHYLQPFYGRVLRSYLSPNINIELKDIEIPEKIEHLLIYNYGFGLIDLKGNMCIQPGHKDIQKTEYGFILDKDNKYGYAALDYSIICEPKYASIEEVGNGFKRVSVSTSFGLRYGIIDQSGKECLEPIYISIGNMNKKGEADIITQGMKYGIVDSNYNIIKEPCEREYIANTTIDNISTPLVHKSKFGDNILRHECAAKGLVWIYEKGTEKIGLATDEGKILVEPKYGKIEPFINGYAKVNSGYWYKDEEYDEDDFPHWKATRRYIDGSWGVINNLGQEVIPTKYSSIQIEEDGTYVVSKHVAINQREDCVVGLVTGCRLNKDGELIIKNEKGEYILADKKYDWQSDFDSVGRSEVNYHGDFGFVNKEFRLIVPNNISGTDNDIVIPEEYDWWYEYADGLIVVINKDGKYGVIDIDGQTLIAPIYEQIKVLRKNENILFNCGKLNDLNVFHWRLADVKGNMVTVSPYIKISQLGENLLVAETEQNKFAILDSQGRDTIDMLFDVVHDFDVSTTESPKYSWEKPEKNENQQYAIVGIDDKYGLIDRHGELLLFPKYRSLTIQSNGYFIADGSLIDMSERRVLVKEDSVIFISDDYKQAQLLDNGLIIASKYTNLGVERWGCINQVGKIVIPHDYKSISYCNGLLLVTMCDNDWKESNERTGVINFYNEIIIPFSREYSEIEIGDMIISYKRSLGYENGGLLGAYTRKGQLICEPKYNSIVPITNNLMIVCKITDTYYDYSKNWGIIDFTGNEILRVEYDWIADKPINGLIKIQKGERYGYIDIMGNLLLEPRYKTIGDFVDGYAIVSKEAYYDDRVMSGVIDSLFNEIIPCSFYSVEYEPNDHVFITDKGRIKTNGQYIAEVEGKELLLPLKYLYCEPFQNGSAIAVCENKSTKYYGLINSRSEDIVPPIFERLQLLDNGLYKFRIKGRYGLLDSNGNIIATNKYDGIGKFSDDLACVQIKIDLGYVNGARELYGYINSKGDEVLPVSYEFIGKRYNQLSVVLKDGVWGVFDIENYQVKIIPNVAFLGPCMDNRCRINVGGSYDKKNNKTTGGLWGYVSPDGQIVIEPIYEQVYAFCNGMAAVKFNGKWGFINTEGIIVVPCEFDKVESNFKNREGRLVKNGEIFVFDKLGKQIKSYEQKKEDDDYYDGSYEDNIPSVYDNPYYNDNLDMDQQSIEFWNSL